MIKINIFNSQMGLGIEAINKNLICSAFYEGSSVIDPKLGPVGITYNLSIEDAVDLIEIALIQNTLDPKKSFHNLFINGFSNQMDQLKGKK